MFFGLNLFPSKLASRLIGSTEALDEVEVASLSSALQILPLSIAIFSG